MKVVTSSTEICYTYDAFHRRLTRSELGQPTQNYLYQGQEEIGVYQDGKITQLKLHNRGKRTPAVAIELEGTVYVPVHDLFGSVATLADLQGRVIESYRYTAFGECQILDASGHVVVESQIGNPWRFANKRFETATGFVSFGLRDYDPDLGRWLCPDPAGFEDGSNLYAYVHHSPLIHYDQFGLFSIFDSPFSDIGNFVLAPFRFVRNYCCPMRAQVHQASFEENLDRNNNPNFRNYKERSSIR